MRSLPHPGLSLLLSVAAAASWAGPPDRDSLRLANWLVGSFDTRAQVAAERAGETAPIREVASMSVRPIDDPVVFTDGLYLYVEARVAGETRPDRQRVYRVRKSGARIRLEVFTIDAQMLGPLALDAQMLSSLNPGDLKREAGCDVVFDIRGDEFIGATGAKSCKSERPGSAWVISSMRVTKDLVEILDRGYDENGVQTRGPAVGRGLEFRRVPQP